MRIYCILSLLLVSAYSYSFDECSHYYEAKGSFLQKLWGDVTSNIRKKPNVDFEKFIEAKEKLLKGERLALLDTNEKLAYLNVVADKETSNLADLIESFNELPPKTQKALWKIPNKIIDSKGRVVQSRTQKYLAKFYEVYYKVPNVEKLNLNKFEEIFAKQIQRDLAISRLEKFASEEKRLKVIPFLRKGIRKLFSNTKFQVAFNVSFNISVVSSVISKGTLGIPYLGKINFYRIGPNIIEDALLYDLNYAVKTHFPEFSNRVKSEYFYDSLRKVVNKVALGAFIVGGLYKVIDEAYLTEKEKKELEEIGDEFVDEQIQGLEEKQDEFSKKIDSIDSRDTLFKLFLIKHESETGKELTAESEEYLLYWQEVYGAEYPLKKDL